MSFFFFFFWFGDHILFSGHFSLGSSDSKNLPGFPCAWEYWLHWGPIIKYMAEHTEVCGELRALHRGTAQSRRPLYHIDHLAEWCFQDPPLWSCLTPPFLHCAFGREPLSTAHSAGVRIKLSFGSKAFAYINFGTPLYERSEYSSTSISSAIYSH